MIFRYFICSFLLWNFIIAQEDTALSFDGVDDYVQIIDDPSLVLGDFFTIRVRLGVDLSVNTEDDDYEMDLKGISKVELEIMKHVVRFYDRIEVFENKLEPHILCDYVYELTKLFNEFYYQKTVIHEDGSIDAGGLFICKITQLAMKTCFSILGLYSVNKM